MSLLYLFFLASAIADPSVEIKEKISKETLRLEQQLSPIERSEVHYKLAQAFCADQELEKAFSHFLDALKDTTPSAEKSLSKEEEKIYREALTFYLEKAPVNPIDTSRELLEKYGKISSENPNFLQLSFLLSTAHANLGNYPLFFEGFYRAYPYLSDSYLAHKTHGILYLRLAQHESDFEKRASHKTEALGFLNAALDKNPSDVALYKILLAFAKEENRMPAVLSYLQKLAKHFVAVPRSEVFLFVREAVDLEEYELAQEIIDQARKQYQSSRALSAAQDYLDQHKQG